MATNTDLVIPLFDGEYLHIWKVRMKTYLKYFDLWVIVEFEYENDDEIFSSSKHVRSERIIKVKPCISMGYISLTLFFIFNFL